MLVPLGVNRGFGLRPFTFDIRRQRNREPIAGLTERSALFPMLALIRHYFEAAWAMSPTAVDNGTPPLGSPRNPLRVMFRAVSAFEHPARSSAHGFRSHRPRLLLALRKFCRIRVNSD